MRAVGLVTEYNPFHNGHLHHLRESLKVSGAEVAVAVMSGHFLQRGEPALCDKWLRTRMALAAGVDVVVELPLPFACNSAPHFATGAMRALAALGVASVCFGSESGALPALQRSAALLEAHADAIARQTAARLRQGQVYPLARAEVVAALAGPAAAELLSTPNNILGLAYLRALLQHGLPLQPFTIPRHGPGYHDSGVVGDIASATGIRRRLDDGLAVDGLMPPTVHVVLQQAQTTGQFTVADHFYRLVLAALLRADEGVYLLEHGMHQRLQQAAENSDDLPTLIAAAHGPQWTRTRLQRTLCHLLLDSRAEQYAAFLDSGPLYLHLLGCSPRGRQFLAASRQRRSLPLIDNYSRIDARLHRFYGRGTRLGMLAKAQLRAELQATRTFMLLLRQRPSGGWSRDFFAEVLTTSAE